MHLLENLWLIPLGFGVGACGTLIGAGGGFVLVPVMLLMFPKYTPTLVTSISLAVVCCNAASGSLTYARMKRIDYKSALIFAVATIPGAILGAIAVTYIKRGPFDAAFGILLMAGAALVLWQTFHPANPTRESPRDTSTRTIVESDGTIHTYAFDPRVGIVISVFVGFISSIVGIGGGIVHVPAMVRVLGFPVHVATATSHLILVVTSLTATIVHVAQGVFSQGVMQTVCLAIGALVGAPLGARLSRRIGGRWIIGGLALALACVGVRLFVQALWR